jgi:DNA polymerase
VLAELDFVRPEGVVLLGSTAGKSFFGSKFRVGEQRGQRVDLPMRPDVWSLATIHPSAILRAENRDELFDGFVADLRTAAQLL